ncbi:leucyl/phenylalanyl-tRNA--protein transferase [Kangiella sp.]|uniref:leucyl/phenylalanyl-tRNA--protein transferase n=1 Tax=Kangiella sp. TaxID=1920245 RepID=UPI003A92C40A
MANNIFLLDETPLFPDPRLAQAEPNGLLAIGGDLSIARLTEAYRNGIFPWFCEDEPILWWSPDPRCVFMLDEVHVSRSLRRELKKARYSITINKAFAEVMNQCAAPRADQPETWILPEMQQAYYELHQSGLAHSIEVWENTGDEETLVGGMYGVSMGRFFFGESMFSRRPSTSKIALIYLSHFLKQAGFSMIDAQVGNPHLYRMGARDMTREEFLWLLKQEINWQQPPNLWQSKILRDWED